MQMEQRDKMKKTEVEESKAYNTKAHFGPEENEEVALYIMKKNQDQKMAIRNAYLQQMELTRMDKKLGKDIEKAQDNKNLETIIEYQTSEEEAKRLKQIQNQQKLKKAWLEQMRVKQIKENYEKIFD
jgi:tRNA nucleotidyltransferase (CCA-adding enzyme)